MKKIGIIGSGAVGTTLAAGFVQKGYEVMIGSRSTGKLEDWKKENNLSVAVGNVKETAGFGEIIVLAVKGSAATNALDLAGSGNLKNKTIIDVCNPISDAPPEDGVLGFYTGLDKSLMEDLQEKFAEARFVKAFNSVGSALMVDPDFGGEKPTMFIGGNHEGAKDDVKAILEKFGWEVADMGTAKAARAIEPLCILWCIPGLRENRWNHAFKLLKP
ncbi:MAG TPA: NAD(P)-binding domain-containing protein [Bacteroidales bacterium]|nr:NAD(P)-binding domain-containing protein [Bacteroidales bacterium]